MKSTEEPPRIDLTPARDAFEVTATGSLERSLRRLGWMQDPGDLRGGGTSCARRGLWWTRTSEAVAGLFAEQVAILPTVAPRAEEAVARARRGETVFRALTLDYARGEFRFRGETRRFYSALRAGGFRTHPRDDGSWEPYHSPHRRDAAKILVTDLASVIEVTEAARAALGDSPEAILASKPLRLRYDPLLEQFAFEGDTLTYHEAIRACGFRTKKRDDGTWAPWSTANTACVDEALRSNLAGHIEVDASVQAALAAHHARIEASRRADGHTRALAVPAGLDYLPFQKNGIAGLLDLKNALLGDDMGLGKTVQAVGVWNNDPARATALIVCPQSVLVNWAREWVRWSIPARQPRKLVVVTENEPVPPDADVVIVNYDKLIDVTHTVALDPPTRYVARSVRRGHYAVVPEGDPAPPAADAPTFPRAVASARARACTEASRVGTPLDPVKDVPQRRGTAAAASRWRAQVDKEQDTDETRAAAFGVFWVEDGDAPGAYTYDEVEPPATAKVVTRSAVLPSLLARRWGLLVVDEAHRVKRDPQGKPSARSVAVLGLEARRSFELVERGLAQACDRALYLTGTPIPNRVVELWPLLRVIDPTRWNDFFRFGKRYCDAHIDPRSGHWDFSGASNLEELQDVLRASCMVRRMKADVLPELPPKRRQVLVLPRSVAGPLADDLDEAEAAAEADLETLWGALRCVDATESAYGAAVASLEACVRVHFQRMAAVRRDLALRKAPFVAEHVVDLLEGGVDTVVVMAHHHEVQDLLRARIEAKLGAGVCVLHRGDLSPARKQEAVDRFQGVAASLSPTGEAIPPDPAVRVFVGSIQASGVGLTLTRSALMVFAELDWVPANVSQAEDREHRIGQKESILVQHVVVEGTLDERIARAIVAKQEVIDRALDAKERAAREFALAPDRLPAQLLPKKRPVSDALPVLGVPRGPANETEAWAADVLRAAQAGEAPPRQGLTPGDLHALRALVADLDADGLSDGRWRLAVVLAKRIRGGQPHLATGPTRPAATAEEVWAAGALGQLAASDPDRARELNHVGFSASDGVRGHALALAVGEWGQLDDDGWRAAVRLAWRYTRQCPPPDAVRDRKAQTGRTA